MNKTPRRKSEPKEDMIFLAIALCTKSTGESIGLAMKLTAYYRVLLPYLPMEKQITLANLLGSASSRGSANFEILPHYREEFEERWREFQKRIYDELNHLLERITNQKSHRISMSEEDDDRLFCAMLARACMQNQRRGK